MDPFVLITGASILIIVSYFYQILAKKTNIPSVLMLMATGIVAQSFIDKIPRLQEILGILGNVGLILIVLEASLDLKLAKEKYTLIFKSLTSATLGILITGGLITGVIYFIYPEGSLLNAALYAVPLAVMSSAIVIPSVSSLKEAPKEFMIYESSISDILGIIFFYLFLELNNTGEGHGAILGISLLQLILTIALGILVSYVLIWLFSRIQEKTKLFLIIAALLLLFALGKIFHLSSLIIIMIFGLMLGNLHVFFKGKLAQKFDFKAGEYVMEELHQISLESAFVIKSFFFFFFGLSINLAALGDMKAWIFGIAVLAVTYGIRFLLLKGLLLKDARLLTYITPRGLISILLFFSIPATHFIEGMNESALLILIIVTNIIMTVGLVKDKVENKKDKQPEETPEEQTEQIDYEPVQDEVAGEEKS